MAPTTKNLQDPLLAQNPRRSIENSNPSPTPQPEQPDHTPDPENILDILEEE